MKDINLKREFFLLKYIFLDQIALSNKIIRYMHMYSIRNIFRVTMLNLKISFFPCNCYNCLGFFTLFLTDYIQCSFESLLQIFAKK